MVKSQQSLIPIEKLLDTKSESLSKKFLRSLKKRLVALISKHMNKVLQKLKESIKSCTRTFKYSKQILNLVLKTHNLGKRHSLKILGIIAKKLKS
jgi:hypothetical protein